MKIGRRIYYDKLTGEVLIDTGESEGMVIESTPERDIETFKKLSERNSVAFDFIKLEFGQYAQDFAGCNEYRVNPDTKQIEFSYPDPNETEPSEPVYQAPLSEEVERLKQEDLNNKEAIAELYFLSMGGF